MNKATYSQIEKYMLEHMNDPSHDPMHIYRVLYHALDIVSTEPEADRDIVIAAALLHDVGRDEQARNPDTDHAEVGAPMAEGFLMSIGWSEDRACHVADCVRTHRYRKGSPPESIEARIIFDADKLDVTGAIGIARTLTYGGQVNEPLYLLDGDGRIITEGGGAEISSFFQEYYWKLKRLYDRFLTPRAGEIAASRRAAMEQYCTQLEAEIEACHLRGAEILREALE